MFCKFLGRVSGGAELSPPTDENTNYERAKKNFFQFVYSEVS